MNPTPTWRRLLAAALLAAVFSLPARADDQSQNYGYLFDGSVQHNGNVVAPGGPAISRGAAAPAAPAGMPQDRMDKCLVSAGLGGQDLAFYREMAAKLQTSPHGAEILDKIVSDCEKTSQPVTVKAPDWDGSTVVNTDGLDGIAGLGGQSFDDHGTDRTFEFNHKFVVKFAKHDAAVADAAAIMGHELTHLTLHSEYRQALAQYQDVLHFSLLDEENARVRGFLVAYEMAPETGGDATSETRDAARLAENPQGYFDDMATWNPGYAGSLNQSELRDPITAFNARLKALQDYKQSSQDRLAEIPKKLARLDHLTRGHADVLKALNQQKPVDLLRSHFTAVQTALPHDVEQADKGIARVQELLAQLNGSDGQALMAKLRALSYDPAFAYFVARNSEDIDRLQQLVKERKLKMPAAGEMPMSDATFAGLFNALHGEGAIKTDAPWSELNPSRESLQKYALQKDN